MASKSQAKSHLGNVIKYYLDKKSMSQAELARQLGVNRAAVTHWIKGTNSFEMAHLLKMLEIFEIDFRDFAETSHHRTDWGKFSKNYPH